MHLILYSMAFKFYTNAFIYKVVAINKPFTIIAVVRFFIKNLMASKFYPNAFIFKVVTINKTFTIIAVVRFFVIFFLSLLVVQFLLYN